MIMGDPLATTPTKLKHHPKVEDNVNDIIKDLLKEKEKLEKDLAEKEEKIKKLVEGAQSDNDPQELNRLIEKWRRVCQEALEEYQSKLPGELKPSMKELLHYLHVEKSLVHYDEENECFY